MAAPHRSLGAAGAVTDPMLSRIERDAVRACAAIAVVAAAVSRQWNPPLAVIGGSLLTAISYRGIKGGVDVLAAHGSRGAEPGTAASSRAAAVWALVKLFTRYAILAAAAYVMIVRFRLHPGWICAGASALVLAIAAEAVRVARGTHP